MTMNCDSGMEARYDIVIWRGSRLGYMYFNLKYTTHFSLKFLLFFRLFDGQPPYVREGGQNYLFLQRSQASATFGLCIDISSKDKANQVEKRN